MEIEGCDNFIRCANGHLILKHHIILKTKLNEDLNLISQVTHLINSVHLSLHILETLQSMELSSLKLPTHEADSCLVKFNKNIPNAK